VLLTSPRQLTQDRRVSTVRLVVVGLAAALAAAGVGLALEWWRFGLNDAGAAERLERDLRREFVTMTDRVQSVARSVAADPQVPASMTASAEDRVRALFDAAARARLETPADASELAVTIYDATGIARAWAGRPSDLRPERTKGQATLFVTSSPLGLRLVYVQPIVDSSGDRVRLGSVAVEHVITPAPSAPVISGPSQNFVMPTPVAPVSLRLRYEGAGDQPRPNAFTVAAPDGTPLVEASISPSELEATRHRWRQVVASVALGIVGITALLPLGPLLDRRARARTATRELQLSLAIGLVVLLSIVVIWLAVVVAQDAPLKWPLALLVSGAAAAGLAATAVRDVVRLRVAIRTARQWPQREAFLFVAVQLAWGVVLAGLLIGFERLLGTALDPAAVDLRHFSLHPWGGARLAVLFGILLWHAAVLWGGTLGCVAAIARWRTPHRLSLWHVIAAGLWIAPTAVVAAIGASRGRATPASAVILAAAACAGAALVAARLAVWYRQTTVASRILALFMAFLLPALLIYPSVHFFAERSTRNLIETRYAVEARTHPQDLQDRLKEAQREIDAMPLLPQLVTEAAQVAVQARSPDSAFGIWSQTVLARARLTSDVELYDREGKLVSRFALNFPEYTGASHKPPSSTGCKWDVFGEAQPFGAQERNMLHAERNVCQDGGSVGAVVIHVVLDYRTLPFLRSQSAYVEVFRQSSGGIEGAPAGEVEFTVYGWGLTAIYTSDRSAWPLDDATFARVYRSRVPFWTVLEKENTPYNVYFSNDRMFIYALGYARPGLFDHLVRLAELTTLAAVGYVLILIGTALFSRVARERPQTGRALLREIRASFYRKLFLAFVLAAIVPVLTLALVIRAYFAGLLLDDIRAEASRTAAVAQRVIEESDALLRRGAEGLTPFGDDVMVWISQVIDQDVNIFYGPELSATSERDLFASGLLPTRTSEAVYRAIVLQRLPSYVSEDSIGGIPYMLAATPLRTGKGDAILTVPMAFRQQEVEREIDDLDRGLHLAALFFILFGAGIGLLMAERIADPVHRLTRATGRIARGDFDERVAVRSSDELRRLVDAFNSMAAELKAQRIQLERTHRIEAWAEMARQVAHEIKNPLTPIQLSAEHLRRVHADRGEPMGQVLEGCVDAILGQVRLLRQIAAEFSSFASSPTARPAPVDPIQLVRDVVEPYRAGLEGRIEIQNEVRPPLPPVLIDRTLVTRAIANIVENALHAMPGRGRLLLTSSTRDGFVTIRIADSGVGMDAEALERVFEPYFSTKTTGTGLGLPIARRNIELNGGAIEVESEKGRGTAVTVMLPVA
jgi:signal transduction histidine kinase